MWLRRWALVPRNGKLEITNPEPEILPQELQARGS
jgi:hypothetical protein